MEEILLNITDQVTYRLRKENLLANVVNVQLRTKNFNDTSHQKKLPYATSNTKQIYNVAKELLKELYQKGTAIRLIGLRVDNLEEKDQKQLSIFDTQEEKKLDKLDETIDKLKEKYGYNLIKRGSNLENNIKWSKFED